MSFFATFSASAVDQLISSWLPIVSVVIGAASSIIAWVWAASAIKTRLSLRVSHLQKEQTDIQNEFALKIAELNQRLTEASNRMDLKIAELKLKITELDSRTHANNTAIEVYKAKLDDVIDTLREIKQIVTNTQNAQNRQSR